MNPTLEERLRTQIAAWERDRDFCRKEEQRLARGSEWARAESMKHCARTLTDVIASAREVLTAGRAALEQGS